MDPSDKGTFRIPGILVPNFRAAPSSRFFPHGQRLVVSASATTGLSHGMYSAYYIHATMLLPHLSCCAVVVLLYMREHFEGIPLIVPHCRCSIYIYTPPVHRCTRGRTPPLLTEKWDISAADPFRGETNFLVFL